MNNREYENKEYAARTLALKLGAVIAIIVLLQAIVLNSGVI